MVIPQQEEAAVNRNQQLFPMKFFIPILVSGNFINILRINTFDEH